MSFTDDVEAGVFDLSILEVLDNGWHGQAELEEALPGLKAFPGARDEILAYLLRKDLIRSRPGPNAEQWIATERGHRRLAQLQRRHDISQRINTGVGIVSTVVTVVVAFDLADYIYQNEDRLIAYLVPLWLIIMGVTSIRLTLRFKRRVQPTIAMLSASYEYFEGEQRRRQLMAQSGAHDTRGRS